jgi:L-malate glycosyltransferase
MSKKRSDKQGKEPNESGIGTSDADAHPSKPVRVLVIAPSFDILGGQSVQAARLVERLRQETSLEVGFLPINPRLPGTLRKLQSIRYVRTLVTTIVYVAALLRHVPKYDVIHVFSASYFSFLLAPTPAILISKLYGKKTLLNYHSGEAADHLQRWSRSAIPTIRLVNELVVPSEYLVRVFRKFNLKARPIYNLIETKEFHFRERQPLRPVFLSNRNFERHYGVDLVLRAFAFIEQMIPEARLIVAGDGSQRALLEQLGSDLKLQNVEFVGRIVREHVTEVYDQADIFLNGSEIDNQPLSILEAFACGLPVVTTDAGGIPDMVEHEKTGLVTRCGDYQALADGAIRLLQEPALAQSIIHNGRNECRKYSWEAVHKQWLSLYYELALDGQSQRQLQIEAPGSSERC